MLFKDLSEEGPLARFLRAGIHDALSAYLEFVSDDEELTPRRLRARVARDIAWIDRTIGEQLDAILHAPRFQRLEASWRGLRWLVEQKGSAPQVKVRVLDLKWTELAKDLDRAIEFDQSHTFRKVYSEEFGTPGGEPYGVLLGDYFVGIRPRSDQPVDDVRTLRAMSSVAAAAFAPFVVGAHPSLFGVDSFADLGRPMNFERIFAGTEYVAWNSLRKTEDARFLAVTMPRVLFRSPHAEAVGRRDGFGYRERAHELEHYLWGNSCYAFGSVLLRSFETSGWLGDIAGVEIGIDGGGLVVDLPRDEFGVDRPGTLYKPPTDLVVTDRVERMLGMLGVISLCACKDTPYAAFYSLPSLQQPARHDRPEANRNAQLSAVLQNVLCVSRFAHYMKVLCRDREGSFATADQLRGELQAWLSNYVMSGKNPSKELMAKHPLKAGNVTIAEIPGKPGCFNSVIHLQPHMQLEQLTSSIRLVTEMTTK